MQVCSEQPGGGQYQQESEGAVDGGGGPRGAGFVVAAKDGNSKGGRGPVVHAEIFCYTPCTTWCRSHLVSERVSIRQEKNERINTQKETQLSRWKGYCTWEGEGLEGEGRAEAVKEAEAEAASTRESSGQAHLEGQ